MNLNDRVSLTNNSPKRSQNPIKINRFTRNQIGKNVQQN